MVLKRHTIKSISIGHVFQMCCCRTFLAKFSEEVYFKQTYLGVLSKEKEGDFTKGSSLIFMWRFWMLSTVHLLGNVQHEVKQCQFLQFVGKISFILFCRGNLYYDHNYSSAVFPLKLACGNHRHSFMNTKQTAVQTIIVTYGAINVCQRKTCAFSTNNASKSKESQS